MKKAYWVPAAPPVVAIVLVVAACSGDDDDSNDASSDADAGSDATTSGSESANTLRVPDDYDHPSGSGAKPGGLVLVAPGVYREAVTVETLAS